MAYLFLTAPTSGTASMQRIVQAIAPKGIALVRVASPAVPEPGVEGTFLDPERNAIYWFQGPRHWNPAIDLSRFRCIVHMRDPRDLACNQYWWALQHPNTNVSPELAEIRRRKVEDGGIDQYVLGRNNQASYDMLMTASDAASGDATTYTSYAQLCCAFDLLMDNLCRTFGRAQSEVAEALRIERPENLTANADWVKVGGTWKGSDITPGRHRRELRPESQDSLVTKYARELAFCRRRDTGFLAYHYS